ncbi:MAG: ADP-ribosylglycohydrolase family protein [Candidatus Acetothermia bacterium]|nr:ADP-ribosylglycohydrolase family protein [Candidatus Acetothermia bacterium]
MTANPTRDEDVTETGRAQGYLLGQLAGDALGSLVEFQHAQETRERYPQGVRDLAAGGVWGTIAGQPTDDSEMALALAQTLVRQGSFDPSSTVGFEELASVGHLGRQTQALAPGGRVRLTGGGTATPTAPNTLLATPLSGGRRT